MKMHLNQNLQKGGDLVVFHTFINHSWVNIERPLDLLVKNLDKIEELINLSLRHALLSLL